MTRQTTTLDTITTDMTATQKLDALIQVAIEQQDEITALKDELREKSEWIDHLTDELESLQDEVRAG